MQIFNKAMMTLTSLTLFLLVNHAHANVTSNEYEVIDVPLSQLHPTQAVIAHAQVEYKLNRYRFEAQKMLDDICEVRGLARAESGQQPALPANPTCTGDPKSLNLDELKTAVRGPDNQLYLTDGHHTFSTFYEMPGGGKDFTVRVLVTEHKTDLSMSEFWQWMQDQQLTWLKDAAGDAITPAQLPVNLGREYLANDDFRAAIYFLRDLSWQKPSPAIPFVEFYWADFLRQHAMLQPPQDLNDLHSYMRWLDRLAGFIGGMSSDTVLTTEGEQQTAAQLGRLAESTPHLLDELICKAQAPGRLGYALLNSNAQALQHCTPNRQPLTQAEMIKTDELVSALIEISSGSLQKWQQSHTEPEWLEWEQVNGSPRWIRFLGYPTNYGIIPDTLLDVAEGGDGDPLDVLVLGSPLP